MGSISGGLSFACDIEVNGCVYRVPLAANGLPADLPRGESGEQSPLPREFLKRGYKHRTPGTKVFREEPWHRRALGKHGEPVDRGTSYLAISLASLLRMSDPPGSLFTVCGCPW